MSTLSFHAGPELAERVRSAARKRRIPISRYLKEVVEQSLDHSDRTGRDLRGLVSGSGTLSPEESVLPPWKDDDLLER